MTRNFLEVAYRTGLRAGDFLEVAVVSVGVSIRCGRPTTLLALMRAGTYGLVRRWAPVGPMA